MGVGPTELPICPSCRWLKTQVKKTESRPAKEWQPRCESWFSYLGHVGLGKLLNDFISQFPYL